MNYTNYVCLTATYTKILLALYKLYPINVQPHASVCVG